MWRSGKDECLLVGPANTGKSRGCIQKLHFCAGKYPNARILMARKTRKSLTQSGMVTYEKKVLPPGYLGNLIHWRTQEQEYRYPNGSIIAVGGLDDDEKIMSSEWDIIFVMEATELRREATWEALSIRCRNKAMPYQQLLADANPSSPKHWLKKRCDRKLTQMIESRHEDNPSLTAADMARLDALTGVRKDRLRYGRWAAAEGLVYPEWDSAYHIVSRQQLSEWMVFRSDGTVNREVIRRVVAGVDWGYTNPGTIQIYGLDSDERAYLLREVYRVGQTDDWWVEQALALDVEFGGIEQFVCDPSMPAYIKKFRDADLPAIGAVNDIGPGIEAMKKRLAIAGDGRPRLQMYEYALEERDEVRDEASLPCGLEEEIDEYVWAKGKEGQNEKELPVPVHNHGLDASRYVCKWLEETGGDTPYLITSHATTPAPAVALPKAHTPAEDAPDAEKEQIARRQEQNARFLRDISGMHRLL